MAVRIDACLMHQLDVFSLFCVFGRFAGENNMLAVEAGVIDAVVAIMKTHGSGRSDDVTRAACWAMATICSDNGAFSS